MTHDPVPHADRDGSEQPIVWPPKQRRDASDIGMFTVDTQALIDALTAMQHARCCYGTTEGDGRTCDCKFGWTPESPAFGEQTGCPELRQAIRTLAKPGTSQPTAARAAHASGAEGVEPVRASEAQVEAAIKAFLACESGLECGHPDILCVCVWQAVADAVVAAGPDADEVTRLRAEVERLNQVRVEQLRFMRDRILERDAEIRCAEAAEAERDRLAATVERVEALAKHTREVHAELPQPHGPWTRGYETAIRDVVRILDDPAATPETPHAPAGRDESTSGQSGEGEALGGAENGVETIAVSREQLDRIDRGPAVDLLAALQRSTDAAIAARRDDR